MNSNKIRESSTRFLSKFGCLVNEKLPIHNYAIKKNQDEVIGRILCLDVCISVSYGFDRALAEKWIESEDIGKFLTVKERLLLDGLGKDLLIEFHLQADALFLLLWYVGLIHEINFSKPLISNVVDFVPDLRVLENSKEFRGKLDFRSTDEVVEIADLAYMLHWSFVNSRIVGVKFSNKINPVSLIERRRAIEWLVSDADWDEVCLDT